MNFSDEIEDAQFEELSESRSKDRRLNTLMALSSAILVVVFLSLIVYPKFNAMQAREEIRENVVNLLSNSDGSLTLEGISIETDGNNAFSVVAGRPRIKHADIKIRRVIMRPASSTFLSARIAALKRGRESRPPRQLEKDAQNAKVLASAFDDIQTIVLTIENVTISDKTYRIAGTTFRISSTGASANLNIPNEAVTDLKTVGAMSLANYYDMIHGKRLKKLSFEAYVRRQADRQKLLTELKDAEFVMNSNTITATVSGEIHTFHVAADLDTIELSDDEKTLRQFSVGSEYRIAKFLGFTNPTGHTIEINIDGPIQQAIQHFASGA